MTRRPSARWLALAGGLIAALGIAFVVRSLVANWDETQELLRDAQVGWLVVAVPIALTGMTGIGIPWQRALTLVGGQAKITEVLQWYFPGQMGKYVPGGVWPVVGRGELAAKGGVPRPAAYSSVGLSLAATYLGAVLLALISFAPAVRHISDNPPVWVFVLLPAGLLVLHPKVLVKIIAVGERVLGKAVDVRLPSWRDTVVLVVMHVPAWLLIGTATWCVVRAFTPSPPFAAVVFATMVSWVVGFVAIGVPGGLGVREATFAAVLSVALPAGVGAAAALAARLVFMLVDTLGAMAVAAVGRRRRPAEPVT
jgi:glycosyltransferase 2 family protein